jgi:hypothetical protein
VTCVLRVITFDQVKMVSGSMTTYPPDRRRQWRLCLVTLGTGASALIIAFAWRSPHAADSVDFRWVNMILIVIGILFLPVGLLLLQALVRHVPRLILDEEKLTLRSIYRTSSVKWEDLGIFVPDFKQAPPRSIISATARIPRPAAGRWWVRSSVRNSVEIPNAFLVPLEVILDDIAARNLSRSQAQKKIG